MADNHHPPSQNPAVVALGSKMPVPARKVPVLDSGGQAGAVPAQSTDESKQARSEIADGLNFVGNAVLHGVCTIKGHVEGNLKQAPGTKGAVIVTETGYVKGDIVADQISIMGRTEGLLDATGGSVSLHDSANVSGHVRYFRIQVNGSELNATLERAAGNAASAAGAAPKATQPPVPAPAPDAQPEAQLPPPVSHSGHDTDGNTGTNS